MANRILRTWNDRLRSTCLEAWKSYTETCRRAKNEERIHGEMAALKDECAAPRSAPPRPCRPQGAGRVSDHTARAAHGDHASSSSLTSPRSSLLPLCRYAKAVEEMKAKELSAAEKEAIKQERMAQRLFGKLQAGNLQVVVAAWRGLVRDEKHARVQAEAEARVADLAEKGEALKVEAALQAAAGREKMVKAMARAHENGAAPSSPTTHHPAPPSPGQSHLQEGDARRPGTRLVSHVAPPHL